MATLALGLVGSVFGPVGGAIGAFVGGLIDNFVLFPSQKPSLTGPRLDDLRVTIASEGAPVRWIIGPRNRVPGTVIWKSDIIPVQSSETVGKGGGQKVESESYFIDIAISLGDTRTTGITRVRRIWADSKLIYDNGQDLGHYESLNIYDGSQTVPSALIESYKGAGNVAAYIKTCYFEIERHALADFGNRVPNYTAEVEQAPDVSVGDAISSVMTRWGFEDTDFDVSGVRSCFKGMVTTGPQPGDKTLAPILLGYAIGVQESDKVRFFPLGSEDEILVDEADFAAHEGSEEVPRPIKFRDINDYEVPAEIPVTFISNENDLQQGSTLQRRIGHRSSTGAQIVLPLTLNSDEANAIAKRNLWAAEAERRPAEFTLPPSFLALQEGDVIVTTVDDREYRIFCKDVTRGDNFAFRVSGNVTQSRIYSQTGVGTPPGEADPTPETMSIETEGYVADLPALIDDHTLSGVGLYWWVTTEEDFPGVRLYSSSDDLTYIDRSAAVGKATMGFTRSMLAEGPSATWDRASSVEVELTSGSASSVTESQCLSGANRGAIKTATGWEVFGFATVTEVGENRFVFTDLLRGLRGTEHEIDQHVASDAPFILLQQGQINWMDRGMSGLGTNDYYKFPAVGGNLADYDATQQRMDGVTKRPFSPTHIEGEWNTGGDLTVTWNRRSKRVFSVFSPSLGPLTPDESPETYVIVFRQGGELAPILRSVTVNSPTYTYTAADQGTDGVYSPGSTALNVWIYQISSEVGRGIPGKKYLEP